MGNKLNSKHKCQPKEEKEKLQPEEPSQDQPEPDFNSQSEELPDNSEPEDTPPELVPELQFTLLPSLSTSPLRSSSSQVTPPETTREAESSQDTSNSLSETMMNSPDS